MRFAPLARRAATATAADRRWLHVERLAELRDSIAPVTRPQARPVSSEGKLRRP